MYMYIAVSSTLLKSNKTKGSIKTPFVYWISHEVPTQASS
jgi:hypothetical protein